MTKFKGIIYASLGAAFFGISSIIAGLLFNRCSIEPGWLVTTRMLPITKKSVQKMGDNSLKNLSIFFVQ